jgi:hypothetical protein
MDPAIRSKRHGALWDAANTRVKRTVITGLIFAGVVLLRVIEPYADADEKRADLVEFEQRMQQVGEELARLELFGQRLEEISRAVEAAAWNRHKNALIERFARGQVSDPQPEADSTIREIAAQIRGDIVEPLAKVVAEAGLEGDLAQLPAEMSGVVNRWEQDKIGQQWFVTVRRKGETVDEIGETMRDIEQDAMQAVTKLRRGLAAERDRRTDEQARLVVQIEAMKVGIQKAVDEAVPAWARGLVPAEWMVRLYPWTLVAIALYLVAGALVALRHFLGMAESGGWSEQDRRDPVFSSLWTPTWRGLAGTAAMLASYTAVLSGLWYCLDRSIRLVGVDFGPAWLLHLLMLASIVTVFAVALRQRPSTVDSL